MTPSSPEPASPDETTVEIEPFDPEIHVSPHALFRWLRDAEKRLVPGPLLLDLDLFPIPPFPHDPHPSLRAVNLERSLRGLPPLPPPGDVSRVRDQVLVDADGQEATRRARQLREDGREQLYALYGGLELYDYALDPQVVGDERFLCPPGFENPGY